MNENQRELRRTAAREFMQSLEQLEVMLKSDASIKENRVKPSPMASQSEPPPQADEIALDSLVADETLDEVAADIERYMEANQSEELEATD